LTALSILDRLMDRFRGKQPKEPEKKVNHDMRAYRERTLELQLERLRSLLRQIASLNATLNYERVLETTLDLAASALSESGVADARLISALLLFTEHRLFVAAARGLSPSDLRAEFPGEQGIIENSLVSGDISICQHPSADPELRRLVAFYACDAAVCIPLVVGLEIYGLLLFGHPEQTYFTEERLELLQAIAQQARVALQNAQLYRDLEQEKERITEIQDEARKKLARDLHDGPTQSIGAIAMRVNFARRLVMRDPNAAADELFKIEELARRTTKEIRQMLFTLRPLVLESEGLVAALNQLSEKMLENHNQNVIIQAAPEAVEDLEVGKQGVIFFIIEEAVNNARKHANASHIWVRLARKGDLLYLEVEDDGAGFDLSAVEANYRQRSSLGMVNLRERAELVNGVLRIDTAIGRGTRIAVTVPMTVEAAERFHKSGFVS
jgi:signal transduction histidine kinase